MSYSFSVKAADKDAAKQAVAVEFDKIVASQPIHARDQSAVLASTGALVDLLADDDTKDVLVVCSGSISYGTGVVAEAPLSSANLSCTVNHTPRLLTPGQ